MRHKMPRGLPKGIVLISIYSFFCSVSVQMIYSQLALFLKYKLNVNEYQIASIDGFVEFLSYIVRIFSGIISDYMYNRSLLLVVGCSLAVLIKPVFCFASSALTVLITEIAERIGNGVQSPPRDAFIADLSKKNNLGTSFGFCRSMKTLGAISGAVISLVIMYFSQSNYRLLFICAAIPAFIALIVVCNSNISRKNYYKNSISNTQFDNPFQKKYLKSLDRSFFHLMLLAFLCEFGHFAESLLTIRCSELISSRFAGITSVFASIGQILFLYPFGLLADRIKRSALLTICVFIIMTSYILMMFAESVYLFLLGVLLSCGQFASIQIVFLSMINDIVNFRLRATAIGIFYSVIGCSYLISSKICGWIYINFGYNKTFLYTLIVCVVSFIASLFFLNYEKK